MTQTPISLPFTEQRYSLSPEGSLVQSFRRETKIANITYRIRSLSNFVSAAKDLLDFVSLDTSIFPLYQQQIIDIVELARKTLQSAGIVLFLWASCPAKLEAHKLAYVDLLRILQANQKYVDTQSKRLLRVLLMPLTSQFSTSSTHRAPISPGTVPSNSPTQNSSSRNGTVYVSPQSDFVRGAHAEASSSTMLPPNDSDDTERPSRSKSTGNSNDNLSQRRLWDPSELGYASVPPKHRSRSRHPHRLRHDADNARSEQENVAPSETTTQFRPAPTRQRFGIFLTGKSSMLGNYNRKERISSRPTH